MDDKGNLEQEEGKLEQGELEQYEKHYDENTALRLLKKLRKETREKSAWIAGPVGKIVWALGHLLSAYSNPALPAKYRVIIAAAIGYIVFPFDLIPDAIPVVGWTDDVTASASLVPMIMIYSNFSLEKLDEEIDEEEKRSRELKVGG